MRRNGKLRLLALGGATMALSLFAAAQAGGLRPAAEHPAAAPGATKIGALPFTITECGTYVVVRCLTGVAGHDGITIDGAADVTIDLNGFTLAGVPGSLDGIRAFQAPNVVVRNGVVRDFGGDGIDLVGAPNARVSDVRSCGNGGDGIRLGDEGLVDSCLARDNGGDGIRADRCALVVDCVSTLNDGNGIVAGIVPNVNSGSVVRSSAACFNLGYGIRIAPAGVVADCAVVQNSGGAIEANFALVRGNSAGGAIDATSSTVIENHNY